MRKSREQNKIIQVACSTYRTVNWNLYCYQNDVFSGYMEIICLQSRMVSVFIKCQHHLVSYVILNLWDAIFSEYMEVLVLYDLFIVVLCESKRSSNYHTSTNINRLKVIIFNFRFRFRLSRHQYICTLHEVTYDGYNAFKAAFNFKLIHDF